MRFLTLIALLGSTGVLLAQGPTFTFTPAHGNAIKGGYFSPRGPISFTDQYDGNVYMIEPSKIESIVLTARTPPFTSKCGTASRAIITLTDHTREHGCFGPAPVAFIGSPGSIASVGSVIGKFVREK